MKITVATDYAGLPLKALVLDSVRALGHEAVDFGTNSDALVDYPDVIARAARVVASPVPLPPRTIARSRTPSR